MKTDTPETDAVREMWFIKPNVELGDGRPIHGNVVDVEFARRMERERNTLMVALRMLRNAALNHKMDKDDLEIEDANEILGLVSKSQRKAAGTDDEKPDGQAENEKGMARAQEILDAGRWAGFPLIEAAVTELEECREALKHIHSIVSEKHSNGEDLEIGSTAMKSVLSWAGTNLKEENTTVEATPAHNSENENGN